MSTPAQKRANRENAKHSTGPKTQAGKATSSQNGLKHGLSSDHLMLPGESEEEFNELLAALIHQHQPADITETLLVQDMAKHHWLADRALRMQNHAIAREGNFPPPPTLGILIRYHTANERAFHKALAALNALRKTRLAEIGSVSKSAPASPPPAASADPRMPPSTEKILEMLARGLSYNPITREYDRVGAA